MKKAPAIPFNPGIISLKLFKTLFSTFFLLLLVCQVPAQDISEEWHLMDLRLECTIDDVAYNISEYDDNASASRYTEMGNSLAWDYEWTGPNDDFEDDHWVIGGVFEKTADAETYWSDEDLSDYYDHSNYVAQFYNYLKEETFHGNPASLKIWGGEGTQVDGTYYWKNGPFIFQIGPISRKDRDDVIHDLLEDAELIYLAAGDCNLFEDVNTGLHHFNFDIQENATYYLCANANFAATAVNESNEKLNFNETVKIEIIENGNSITNWNSDASLGEIHIDGNGWPIKENISLRVSYNNISSVSKNFSLSPNWIISLDNTPNEIDYGETISLSGKVETLMPPYLPYDSELYFRDVRQIGEIETFYDCSNTPGLFINEYTAPSKESAGNYAEVAIEIRPRGCLNEQIYPWITIPFRKDADEDEGFSRAASLGTEGRDSGKDLVFDPTDPSTAYSIGEFMGNLNIGNNLLEAPGFNALYLQQIGIDENGDYTSRWSNLIGSSGYAATWAIKVNPRTGQDGGINLVAQTGNTIHIVDEKIEHKHGAYLVFASFDGQGNLLSYTYSDKPPESSTLPARHLAYDMVSDKDGNTIVTGEFYVYIMFAGKALPGILSSSSQSNWIGHGDDNPNSKSLFLVKHDQNNNLLWGFEANDSGVLGFQGDVRGTALASDQDGNIYLAGDYTGSVAIGSTTLEPTGGFIAKLNPDGSFAWVKHIGGEAPPLITIAGMELDGSGGLYITGNAMSYTDFSGMVWDGWGLPPYNASSLFITKYNTEGEPQWVEFARTDNRIYEAYPMDLAVDPAGNSYITGKFNGGALYFDEHELSPAFPDNMNNIIFVCSYDTNGNARWAFMAGDDENIDPAVFDEDIGSAITLDSNGNCYVTGSFTGTLKLGDDVLTSKGGADSFMVKVNGSTSTGIEIIRTPDLQSTSSLAQNYPNPFSQITSFDYSLKKPGRVTLKVYDLVGKVAADLINKSQPAGNHTLKVNLSTLEPGIYFYELISDGEHHVKKMIIR